jgi:predicted aspartyl protease
MIRNIIVAVLLTQQLSFASTDAEEPRIGFSFVHESLVVVPVFLNGRGPYRFLLDTGATNTILSNRVADQLNIPIGKTQTLLTVGGTAMATKRIIDVIRFGNTQIMQLPIIAADLKLMRALHIDGIIGGDCLKQFRISIDYAHQLITIEP